MREHELETVDGERFAEQNPDVMRGLAGEDLETVDRYSNHHAGGMWAISRDLEDDWQVKCHDTWGDPEDGAIVVHVYDPEDDTHEHVAYFADGASALAAFRDAHAPRSYTVGLPVTVTVFPNGHVEWEVDRSESAEGVTDDPFAEDDETDQRAADGATINAFLDAERETSRFPSSTQRGPWVAGVTCSTCKRAVTREEQDGGFLAHHGHLIRVDA